ncbi:hypothetical protein KDM41_00410 [bacterium]|nr:hypothetical protein [bacterium]
MLDLQNLNDHSRQFAMRLFRRWPEWHRLSRFDPYEEFEKEALLVEVPRPRDGSSHGLFITTSEWEISIGFGESFHTRFGSDGSDDPGSFYDEAMAFLEGFVAERIVVAVAFEDGEWLGSWRIDLAQESLDDVQPAPGETVRVRSWLGTWDRDLTG